MIGFENMVIGYLTVISIFTGISAHMLYKIYYGKDKSKDNSDDL